MGWTGGGARRPRGAPMRRRGRARRGRSRRYARSGDRCCRPPSGRPRTRTPRSTTPGTTPPTWLAWWLLSPLRRSDRADDSGEGDRIRSPPRRIWGFQAGAGEFEGNACCRVGEGGSARRRGKEGGFDRGTPDRWGWLGWTGPDKETESAAISYGFLWSSFVNGFAVKA